MPPARKTRAATSNTSGPSARGSQKTLPFNNSTRISKPSSTSSTPSHQKIKEEDILNSISSTPSTTVPTTKEITLGHVNSQAVVKQQAQEELAKVQLKKGEKVVKGEKEEVTRARKISDAQIKRYWKEKESERLAGRVHQGGLSVEEKVLRLFDMSSQYGPCIGIARMKRWTRAHRLKLSPPIEALAVLLKEEDKGNSAIERAYVDELMSSKIGEA